MLMKTMNEGYHAEDILEQCRKPEKAGSNLSGPDFLARKDKIVSALEHQINNENLDRMAALRRFKRTL